MSSLGFSNVDDFVVDAFDAGTQYLGNVTVCDKAYTCFDDGNGALFWKEGNEEGKHGCRIDSLVAAARANNCWTSIDRLKPPSECTKFTDTCVIDPNGDPDDIRCFRNALEGNRSNRVGMGMGIRGGGMSGVGLDMEMPNMLNARWKCADPPKKGIHESYKHEIFGRLDTVLFRKIGSKGMSDGIVGGGVKNGEVVKGVESGITTEQRGTNKFSESLSGSGNNGIFSLTEKNIKVGSSTVVNETLHSSVSDSTLSKSTFPLPIPLSPTLNSPPPPSTSISPSSPPTSISPSAPPSTSINPSPSTSNLPPPSSTSTTTPADSTTSSKFSLFQLKNTWIDPYDAKVACFVDTDCVSDEHRFESWFDTLKNDLFTNETQVKPSKFLDRSRVLASHTNTALSDVNWASDGKKNATDLLRELRQKFVNDSKFRAYVIEATHQPNFKINLEKSIQGKCVANVCTPRSS